MVPFFAKIWAIMTFSPLMILRENTSLMTSSGTESQVKCSINRASLLLLFGSGFASQADLGVFQLFLHLGHFGVVGVTGGPSLVLPQGALPLCDGIPDFTFAEVHLAQMIVHGGIARHVLQGLPQLVLSFRQFVQAIVDPTQTVEVSAAVGFPLQRLH